MQRANCPHFTRFTFILKPVAYFRKITYSDYIQISKSYRWILIAKHNCSFTLLVGALHLCIPNISSINENNKCFIRSQKKKLPLYINN
jgi:hypothetical protein